MLASDTFFRQVPKALEVRQRLILEGAGWAINSIYWAFDQLKAAAREVKFDAAGHDSEHGIFVSCWSIIDQCHMLRKLLSELPILPGGPTEYFIKNYERVTLIRNAMDHLHNQLNNLAESKKQRPPIFGVLSFCMFTDDDMAEQPDGSKKALGCQVVALTAGSLTHQNHTWHIANPTGKRIEVPLGCFEFEAFDHIVSFSELIEDVNALVNHYNTEIKQKIDEGIRAAASEKGLDTEAVLKERGGGGIKIAMKVRFSDADN